MFNIFSLAISLLLRVLNLILSKAIKLSVGLFDLCRALRHIDNDNQYIILNTNIHTAYVDGNHSYLGAYYPHANWNVTGSRLRTFNGL